MTFLPFLQLRHSLCGRGRGIHLIGIIRDFYLSRNLPEISPEISCPPPVFRSEYVGRKRPSRTGLRSFRMRLLIGWSLTESPLPWAAFIKALDPSNPGTYKRYAAPKLLQPARLGLAESNIVAYQGSPAWANPPGRLHGHTFDPRSTEWLNPGEELLKIDTDAPYLRQLA